MAESKRQSSRSRNSTPKPGTKTNTGSGPGEFDLSKAIGAKVKITTATPSLTLEGTLYTACPVTNLVAIDTGANPSAPPTSLTTQPGNYHLVSISRIQSFTVVSLPESISNATDTVSSGFENAQPAISRIDIRALKAREEAAIRKIREKDATTGKGVTKEAQEIFDAMNRSLPCRWHETNIIVNDAVIITKPYLPENCSAPKDQQNSLIRVKKVLENERRKIADKAATAKAASVATPLAAPRKGG